MAIVGGRVILPCRVLNKKGILQWTKDDFGLGTRRKLVAFERYSMVGSDEEGDYSLQIYPVTLDDDAKYQCQVGPGTRGKRHVFSAENHFHIIYLVVFIIELFFPFTFGGYFRYFHQLYGNIYESLVRKKL